MNALKFLLKSFKYLQQEIAQWSIDTFPDLTEPEQWLKLLEELKEYKAETSYIRKIEELADVYIVACVLAERFGNYEGIEIVSRETSKYDPEEFLAAVELKMDINKARIWRKINGVWHHE